MVTYVPYLTKTGVTQDHILDQIDTILAKEVKNGDCVVVLGDFNLKLPRAVEGYVGKFCAHPRPSVGGKRLLDIMSTHGLCAASTYFKPSGTSRRRFGTGMATYMSKTKHPVTGNPLGPSQIDYILVSKRRMSSVKKCVVRWRPSLRSRGYKGDHGLIHMVMRERIRENKKTGKVKKDYGALKTDDNEELFDAKVGEESKKEGLDAHHDLKAEEMYRKMVSVLTKASQEVIPSLPKQKGKTRNRSERTLKLLEQRQNELENIMKGSKEWMIVTRRYRNEIAHSCREDYREYVELLVDAIKVAAAKNDLRGVSKGVSELTRLGKYRGSKSPVKKEDGTAYASLIELAEAWAAFAENKFKATAREEGREELPNLGPSRDRKEWIPTDEHLEKCLKALSISKAAGWDEVVIELFKSSSTAKEQLFELMRKCWREEEVPEDMVKGVIVPLFKNKGSANDMSKYRFVCLLTHVYKMFAATVLLQVAEETEGFLPESQAGFRKNRGCRDNVVTLAILLDFCLEEDNSLILTYLDYVAAFDTVSHKFLDVALGEAGASAKSRSLIRAIYTKATAVVRVRSPSGEEVYSKSFVVRRGVLQGCILSPRLFIIAAALIMDRHDCVGGGAQLREMLLKRLEYADDACMVDISTESASKRATAIQAGAVHDADVVVSVPKSEVQHIQKQEEVPSPTKEDYERAAMKGKAAFQCEFCGKRFNQPVDLRHLKYCPPAQRGLYDGAWEIEKILDVRGSPETRFFQVHWKHSWKKDQITWEPKRNLDNADECVEEFWASHPHLNGLDTITVDGEFRCEWCGKFFTTAEKSNRHRCYEKSKKDESRASSKAKQTVKRMMQAEAQTSRKEVKMGEDKLKAVFSFNYLGMSNTVDADPAYPIEVRLAKAATRFSELHNIWRSETLNLKVKLQLFESGVCSMATHAFEAWKLNDSNINLVKLWAVRRLSFITGNSFRAEWRYPSLDVISIIRVRRLQLLGKVLRMDECRYMRKAILALRKPYPKGSILMDAPRHDTTSQLIAMAEDAEAWQIEVNALKQRLKLTLKNSSKPRT